MYVRIELVSLVGGNKKVPYSSRLSTNRLYVLPCAGRDECVRSGLDSPPSLSISVLDPKTAPGVVPLQGLRRAGHPATATFQTARVLYQDLSRLLVDGIQPCRTNRETRLEITVTTDLLSDNNMRFLIVLKDIDTELISRVHHILLNLHRSLMAARSKTPSLALFHTVEEIRFLGPSPIQKISSMIRHSHWG